MGINYCLATDLALCGVGVGMGGSGHHFKSFISSQSIGPTQYNLKHIVLWQQTILFFNFYKKDTTIIVLLVVYYVWYYIKREILVRAIGGYWQPEKWKFNTNIRGISQFNGCRYPLSLFPVCPNHRTKVSPTPPYPPTPKTQRRDCTGHDGWHYYLIRRWREKIYFYHIKIWCVMKSCVVSFRSWTAINYGVLIWKEMKCSYISSIKSIRGSLLIVWKN